MADKKEVHVVLDEEGRLRSTWEPGMTLLEVITMLQIGLETCHKKMMDDAKVIVPANPGVLQMRRN